MPSSREKRGGAGAGGGPPDGAGGARQRGAAEVRGAAGTGPPAAAAGGGGGGEAAGGGPPAAGRPRCCCGPGIRGAAVAPTGTRMRPGDARSRLGSRCQRRGGHGAGAPWLRLRTSSLPHPAFLYNPLKPLLLPLLLQGFCENFWRIQIIIGVGIGLGSCLQGQRIRSLLWQATIPHNPIHKSAEFHLRATEFVCPTDSTGRLHPMLPIP